jgi:heme oxygenase (mycobilin-producing)
VSVVKINAITVPREDFDEFVRRYRTPADQVPDAEGFEGFELLQPDDDRGVFFVLTRWRSDADFAAWTKSADFAARHARHQAGGPIGTASEILSFRVVE